MVLEKYVGVVYFKNMGNGNGFSKFKERGVEARFDNGDLVLSGLWSNVLDVRVHCAGTNDRRPCPCFDEKVDVETGVLGGFAWAEIRCRDCKANACKILDGEGRV